MAINRISSLGSALGSTSGTPNPIAASPSAAPNPSWSSGSAIINSLLPGMPQLTGSATGIVQNLLSGMPSTSAARKSNAVFGVNSGLAPGSDFLKTRLYNTYGQQVDQRNQQGIQDLLSLLSGYSGPALQERAQNTQESQFGRSLAEQQHEFAAKLRQMQDQFDQQHNLELEKLGFNRNRYSDSPWGGISKLENVPSYQRVGIGYAGSPF